MAIINLWRTKRLKKKRRVIRFALVRLELMNKPKKEPKKMQIKIPLTLAAVLTFSPTDNDGNTATLDGKPKLEVLEGDAELREVDGKFYLIPSDVPNASSRIKVSGDGEQGEGVTIIEEEIEFTGLPLNAVNLGIGFSTVQKRDVPTAV